ncbi:MAG: hypothetical protein H0U53_09865 [Actinobacteria bacterium]|nr:hypothetical protein [Actinomycetota bacterium]
MEDTELDARDIARLLSVARIVIGVSAWLAPRRFSRAWTGEEVTGPAGTMALRGLGARDAALGMGTLLALEGEGPARRWIEVSALADASDAVSVLMSWGRLSWGRRLIALSSATTGCYLGVKIADSVDA